MPICNLFLYISGYWGATGWTSRVNCRVGRYAVCRHGITVTRYLLPWESSNDWQPVVGWTRLVALCVVCVVQNRPPVVSRCALGRAYKHVCMWWWSLLVVVYKASFRYSSQLQTWISTRFVDQFLSASHFVVAYECFWKTPLSV